MVASAPRASRRAARNWIILTRSTVQVATDASARPIMTAFTTMSACMNMLMGDKASGSGATKTVPSAEGELRGDGGGLAAAAGARLSL